MAYDSKKKSVPARTHLYVPYLGKTEEEVLHKAAKAATRHAISQKPDGLTKDSKIKPHFVIPGVLTGKDVLIGKNPKFKFPKRKKRPR